MLLPPEQVRDMGRTLMYSFHAQPAVRLILLILLASLAGCERYALDRQMEELCKKDGGVKVYETVTLPPGEYEQLFNYVITASSTAEYYGPDYRYVRRREILIGTEDGPQKGRGRLTRWYFAIYRKSDNLLLGEKIVYNRAGGDGFTFGFHPSNATCSPAIPGLGRSVFRKEK